MRISEKRDETVYDSTSRTEHSINKELLKTLTSVAFCTPILPLRPHANVPDGAVCFTDAGRLSL